MLISIFNTFIGTLFGAILGGIFTLALFKKQEHIRIKENMRVTFMNDCRKKYTQLMGNLEDLIMEITSKKQLFDMNKNNLLVQKKTDFGNQLCYDYSKKSPLLHKSAELVYSVYFELIGLDRYITSNKIISGKELSPYNNISEITWLKKEFDELNTLNKKISVMPVYDIEFEYLIDKYNNIVDRIFSAIEKLYPILDEIKDINYNMEKEFIGTIFKNS